jgi:hypothetical protein
MLPQSKKLDYRENNLNVNRNFVNCVNNKSSSKKFSRKCKSNYSKKDLNKIRRTQRRILNRIGLNKTSATMDIPTVKVQLPTSSNNAPFSVPAFLDTGASLNAISEELFDKLRSKKLAR